MPTLTSVVDKSDKEQFNKDTKSDELGETAPSGDHDVFQQMKNIPVAGRPSEPPSISSVSGSTRRVSKQFSR